MAETDAQPRRSSSAYLQVAAILRPRLLALQTLPAGLRSLVVMSALAVLASGFLLFTHGVQQLQVTTALVPQGADLQIPLLIYLVVIFAACIAWSASCSALLWMSPGLRLAGAAIITVVLGAGPLGNLLALADARSGLSPSWLVAVPVAQLLILLATDLVLLLGLARRSSSALFEPRMFLATFLIFAVFYSLDNVLLGFAGGSSMRVPVALTSTISNQSQILPLLFAVIVYWGSTDYLEVAQSAGAGIAALASRAFGPAAAFLLATAIAGGVLFDVIRRFGIAGLAPSLPGAAVVVALMVGVAAMARINKSWSPTILVSASLCIAVFLFIIVQVFSPLSSFLASTLSLPSSALNPLYTVLTTACSLLVILVGLALVARGRRPGHQALGMMGLPFALSGLVILGLNIPQLANVVGLPVIRATQSNIADFKVLAALGAIFAVVWLALQRRWREDNVAPVIAFIMLLSGLQIMSWYFQLYVPALQRISTASLSIAAVLFAGAVLWDLLFSGEHANKGSPALPRSSRVLLQVGYALFAVSTFVAQTSQHTTLGSLQSPGTSASALLEVVGAEGLGIPLLLYTFFVLVDRWRDEHSHN
jgi:hypothetical protein